MRGPCPSFLESSLPIHSSPELFLINEETLQRTTRQVYFCAVAKLLNWTPFWHWHAGGCQLQSHIVTAMSSTARDKKTKMQINNDSRLRNKLSSQKKFLTRFQGFKKLSFLKLDIKSKI